MERNVPKLRFKGFNDEWKLSNLKKLCDINPKSKQLPDKFVYIDLESIIDGVLIKKNIIELKDAPSRAQRLLNVGDVLFQTVRPYQMNNYLFEYELNYKSVASTGYAQLRCKSCISNNKFIYQALHNKKFNNKVMLRCTGTSYPAINSSELVTIPLRIPSLQEQERIANFLTKVDKIIEKQDEKVKNLEKYKKGMMQKIFSQEIRFKDENGEKYPEWKNKNLGELGETYTGLSGKTKENFGVGTSKFITYMNIFRNIKVNFSMLDLVEVGENEKQNKVIKNDLLFTTSSETPEEVGMVSVCTENIENLYLNSFCFGFRINDKESVNSEFMSYLLRSPENRLKISTLAQGSTRYNLSKSELMKMKIKIPCIEEQNSIVKLLSNIDCISINEQEKLLELKQWKRGLLQQMFV
mgnify:CR=1 FL=1